MLKKASIFFFGLACCLFTGCAVNPITGEEELMLLPRNQDIEIGRKYAPEVEKQMGGRIDNPGLQNYINYIGQKVARVSHSPDWEYNFAALKHESVNAFALPGGYIFITRGMLEKLHSEAQLVGVLGHEIGHVVARDSSAAMSREIGITLLLTAVATENASQGVMTVADLASQIVGLKYSRKDERDADLAGMEYTVLAGYDPYGMVETMQMLHEEDNIRPVEFLSTHPSSENRITYLKSRIQTKYYNTAGLKVGKEEYEKFVIQQLPPPEAKQEPISDKPFSDNP